MKTWKNKEAWKEGSNLVTHIGLEYKGKERTVKSFQLVNEQGRAVAVLDFHDDMVERAVYSDSCPEGIEWIKKMTDQIKGEQKSITLA